MNEGSYPQQNVQSNLHANLAQQVVDQPDAQAPLPPLKRPINIQPLNHGFLVNVGCQAFAVETVDALLHRLGVYLKNPYETEQKWLSGEWKW